MPDSLHDNLHVTPYIAAPLDEEIIRFLKEHGHIKKLSKHEYFIRQTTTYNFVYVETGLMGRVRETLLPYKQTHLEVIPPRRVANFLNFFSPGKARISIVALQASQVYVTPFQVVYDAMDHDRALAVKFEQMYGANMETALRSCYCNFIFSCEIRLISLFQSIVRNDKLEADAEGWFHIPFKLTREEFCQVIFSSLLTLDNILLDWKKLNLYRKNREGSFVHKDLIERKIRSFLV